MPQPKLEVSVVTTFLLEVSPSWMTDRNRCGLVMDYPDITSAQAPGVGQDVNLEPILKGLHMKQTQRNHRGGEHPLKDSEGM